MANKRPLAPANTNANNNGGKALRFDITQIKPVIMKRSEIYNKKTTTSTLPPPPQIPPLISPHNSNKPHTTLQSCLRQSRRSWSMPPNHHDVLQEANQNDNVACSVQFRTNVSVRRIPSRHDYSASVRAELWSSLQEIRENALRNEAEFTFDGAQWRNCTEEEDFFFDKRSGCLVHPAHVETVCVFNGLEWKPISQDVETTTTTTTTTTTAMTPIVVPTVTTKSTTIATGPAPTTTPHVMMMMDDEDEVDNHRHYHQREDLESGLLLPSNQVCIVCDFGRE